MPLSATGLRGGSQLVGMIGNGVDGQPQRQYEQRQHRQRVITSTAGVRTRTEAGFEARNNGQVATTIIAHTVAARKGRKTHSDSAISPTMQAMARVLRRGHGGCRAIAYRHSRMSQGDVKQKARANPVPIFTGFPVHRS